MTSTSETDPGGLCQWCSVPVTEGARQCSACGATVILRESIGDLIIPGVTHVDPALAAYAAQPLRIPRASPSQSIAGPAAGALMLGGPAGLIGLGGLAAVAAAEFLGASEKDAQRSVELDRIGQPSGAVLDMVKRLDDKFAPPTPEPPTPEVSATEGGAAERKPPKAPPEADGIY